MLISIIPKDTEATDFNCRDGEIEFLADFSPHDAEPDMSDMSDMSSNYAQAAAARKIRFSLIPERQFPEFNIRIPLREGEAQKASLILNGESSRVDAETAERITAAIVDQTAAEFRRIALDLRREGLFILPFRAFCRLHCPGESAAWPTPQAVILPSLSAPQPEITAFSATSDSLALALRIPVKPARLRVMLPPEVADPYGVELFLSYSLYVPESKDTGGRIGSVGSAAGGNARGVRLDFLTMSAVKASVSAPEKYYLLQGNPNTGYRFASKAAPLPDYSVYASDAGSVAPFPLASLMAEETETDPFAWIADWHAAGAGALPNSLSVGSSASGQPSQSDIPGVDCAAIKEKALALGLPAALLTRPMALGKSASRRGAERRGIVSMAIHGLLPGRHRAMLLGSDDGARYSLLRDWDPTATALLLSPPRRWVRLLLLSERTTTRLCLEIVQPDKKIND